MLRLKTPLTARRGTQSASVVSMAANNGAPARRFAAVRSCGASLAAVALVAIAATGCAPPPDETPGGGMSTVQVTTAVTTAVTTSPSAGEPVIIRVTPSPLDDGAPQPAVTITIEPEPQPAVTVTASPPPVSAEELALAVRPLATGQGFLLPGSHLTYVYGWSPTRNEYAYLGNTDEGTRLIVIDPEEGTSRVVSADRSLNYGFSSFTWSPNGEYLAVLNRSFGSGEDLLVYSRTGGDPVASIHRARVLSADWSSDSARILYSANDAYVSSNYLAKGATINVLVPATGDTTEIAVGAYPAWSPDENLIAYFGDEGGDDSYGVWVLDPLTGDTTQLSTEYPFSYFDRNGLDPNTQLMPAWSPDGVYVAFCSPAEKETSYLSDPGHRYADAFVAKADGTESRRISDSVLSRSNWSPDGTHIRAGVAVYDFATLAVRSVTSVTTEQDYPGGAYAVRAEPRSVILYHWSGRVATAALLPSGWHQSVVLGWSFDGSYLAIYGTGPTSEAESQAILKVGAPKP